MDIFAQIAQRIIEEQEAIIGPVAVERAERVPGLKIDWLKQSVEVTGDAPAVIDSLVRQYEQLFGRLSVEVSKTVTASLVAQLPEGKKPKLLKA